MTGLSVGPFGLVVFTCFGLPTALAVGVGSAFGPLYGVIAFFGLLYALPRLYEAFAHHRKDRPSPPSPLANLVPLPLPQDTHPVHVAVRYRGALTGSDEAIAAFVGGWLVIDGVRTSFALRAVDGCAEWRNGLLHLDLSDDQSVTLEATLHPSLGNRPSEFKDAAKMWIADRERPEGDPILPPLGTLPLIRVAWRSLANVSAIIVMAYLLYSALHRADPLGWLASAPCLFASGFFMRGMFVTQYQDEADRKAEAQDVLEPRSPEPGYRPQRSAIVSHRRPK